MKDRTRLSSLFSLAVVVGITACSSDDTPGDAGGGAAASASTTTSSTTTTAASTTGSGGGGSGGSGGQGGVGGGCLTCSETDTNNAPPTAACPGESSTLVNTLVACLCQDEVCGGVDKGCHSACTRGTTPDEECLACDQEAAMGACMNEFAACLADSP
jgi:hypothetical protein